MHLLVDIAHEQSVEHLLQKLIRSAMERPQSDLACVQIWLADKGDLCSVCPQRPKCPDQTRCLHLVAGGGDSISSSGAGIPRFDDPNARMPLGVGLVGKVAATAQQLVLNGLNERPGESGELDCLGREQIRAFSGSPITFKGEVLGVIAAFNREDIPDEARPWGQIFADHIGAAIANARAFEEIQRLKAQLEQQNAYLKEEVVAAKAFGDLDRKSV